MKYMKEYSYIVYSKVGNKYSITEKYIIDNIELPLELYRYAEGGYAALSRCGLEYKI